MAKRKQKPSKKLFLCGCFAFGTKDHGGQPVKSRETYWALQKKYGEENVHYLETKGWKKHPFRLLFGYLKGVFTHDTIIMLPAHNGLKVFSRLLSFAKTFFGKKIYYDVIGGWLPEWLQDQPKVAKRLHKFDGIWVETHRMKEKLNAQGYARVTVIANFKTLPIVQEESLLYDVKAPYRLCTFSRIVKEKGIEDAIEAVTKVNDVLGYTAYELDLYGQIDDTYQETFATLQTQFPDFIRYCGVAEPSESVSILKDYFLLLFPTYYHGEGFAGTLLDAFAAGLPIVATDWHDNAELVDEATGFLYPTYQTDRFQEILLQLAAHPEQVTAKKGACLQRAKDYAPDAVVEQIVQELS